METNCTEESNLGEWDSRQKGFNFDFGLGEDDSDQGYINYLVDANKIPNALAQIRKDDVSDTISLDSTVSDTSSSDAGRDAMLCELPNFLLAKSQEGLPYESREELRLASFKTPTSLYPSPSDDSRAFITSSIKKTIQALLLGQEVNLEGFRSLSDKKSLLAKAIELNDGNAITAIILFIQKTLRASLFQLILMENKIAANHYIRYLETRSETAKLVDLLCMLGRTQDVLVLRYKTILRSKNLDRIQTQLSHFYAAECSNSDEYMAKLVTSHLHLVETHKALLQDKNHIFNHERHSSVLKTLRYLSENFYDNDVSHPFSPLKFRNTHMLTEKQYGWICLESLSKVQKWPQIESLLIKKGWMASVSFQGKCLLNPEDICDILKVNGAPIDLLSIFLQLIDNPEKRLNTAKRHKCHRVVIDIYASKKDKKEIVSYKSKLEPKSKDYVYAESILKKIP